MQTVNFNCTFCGKLMAVGINLLGRNVRCPHCKQVVQAPASAGPSGAPAPVARREAQFQMPSQPTESHESIFGEAHEDDLFGTRQPKVTMPTEAGPRSPGSPNPLRSAPEHTAPDDAPVTLATSVNAFIAANAQQPDASTSEFIPPEHSWATSTTTSVEPVASAPQNMDTSLTTEERFVPRNSSVSTQSHRESGGPLVWVLLTYAVIATGAVVYLFYTKSVVIGEQQSTEARQHPYMAIPDFFGQYDRAERKKPVRPEGMPPVTLDLPSELKVPLGDTLVINDVEISPIKVEYRHAVRYCKTRGETKFRPGGTERPYYVLKLRVKNKSKDVVLHPADPAFDSKYSESTKAIPYTGLMVGDRRFMGGPFYWPDTQYERQYMTGQEQDEKPLEPAEERDYLIYSVSEATEIRRVIENSTSGGKDLPITWRIQLRTGLDRSKDDAGTDREVSVCSVFGVMFNSSDIAYHP